MFIHWFHDLLVRTSDSTLEQWKAIQASSFTMSISSKWLFTLLYSMELSSHLCWQRITTIRYVWSLIRSTTSNSQNGGHCEQTTETRQSYGMYQMYTMKRVVIWSPSSADSHFSSTNSDSSIQWLPSAPCSSMANERSESLCSYNPSTKKLPIMWTILHSLPQRRCRSETKRSSLRREDSNCKPICRRSFNCHILETILIYWCISVSIERWGL